MMERQVSRQDPKSASAKALLGEILNFREHMHDAFAKGAFKVLE